MVRASDAAYVLDDDFRRYVLLRTVKVFGETSLRLQFVSDG